MSILNLTTRLSASEDVVWRDVDGEIVLLNVATGHYFGLDPIGSRVWQIVATQATTFADVCERLQAEFVAERQTIERDVTALVEELASNHLLSLAAAG